jgi:hypothetical protein
MRAILSIKPPAVGAIILGTFEICRSQLDYLLKANVDSYGMGKGRHRFCV